MKGIRHIQKEEQKTLGGHSSSQERHRRFKYRDFFFAFPELFMIFLI